LTVLGPDGKALPKAPVEIRCNPAFGAAQVREGKFLRSEPDATAVQPDAVIVESNASGRVAIELAVDVRRVEYGVEVPGLAPRWAFWNPAVVPLGQFTLQLPPAWSVGGIVVDGEGKPVEGARICPVRTEFNGRETLETRFGRHCRTDANGIWRQTSVPATQREIKVEIDSPRFAAVRRLLSRAEFGVDERRPPTGRIVLQPGITVSGKVTDERGAPIAGALIRTRLQNALREAVTGADGVYHLRGCEQGICALVVAATGRAIVVRERLVGPDAEPVDFRMKPGRVLRIRVLDQQGKPCPGARVHLVWQHRYADFEFDRVNQAVDRDGRWEWREAPDEQLLAYVEFPGGVQSEYERLSPRGPEHLFKWPTHLTVSGTVTDRVTHQPVRSFRVLSGTRLEGIPDVYYETARYAYDGRYLVRFPVGDQPMHHVVRIEAEGYQPQLSREINCEEKTDVANLELAPGENVEGVILTPAGLPAAGARLAVATESHDFVITNGETLGRSPDYVDIRQTDASGSFRFPPQDRDYYLVIIHPSGYAWFRPLAHSNHRRITLDPWTRVEGTYRVGGKPLGDAPMQLFAGNFNPLGMDGPEIQIRSETVTGPDGKFAFDRVPACSGQVHRVIRWMPRLGHTQLESSCTVEAQFSLEKVARIDVGQNGRVVTGRLKPPHGFDKPVHWEFASIDLAPRDGNRAADGRRFQATIGRDGQFHIDDVPPGPYTISTGLVDFAPGSLFGRPIVVPNGSLRPMDEPLDLGELETQGQRRRRAKPAK
jgi:Carboxypeptidase regulatory-like domain